ncbi:GGDEF and EAL domain-containing protein [Salisediminibacterium beveridgei]|uniref:Diguanylate cyclase/phosphodiesterase (GGDEF & EAL domains) with PAS/PAC sensor(S) n=1 Tax=Salisediminibacterium beveridgei TaxID=632773 RepID=A0A1D7QRE6_9BACI|nr:GGDEF and EAL domain-containing protein [Salisediminibacterium beveridgei]AOM81571.1 diguanylate cyclase/phosphodiesterase (GGDEF & EAL domains) with PAS/PAC sensor(s) [Salisediminibacterium beveridgei]
MNEYGKGENLIYTDLLHWVKRPGMAHFNALFKGSAHAVLVLDARQHVVYCNPQFTSLFGHQREDIVEKPVLGLFQDSGGALSPPNTLDRVFKGEMVIAETERQDIEKKRVPVHLFAYPLIDDDQVTGAVVTYIDRTVAEGNREMALLFERSLKNINDGVMITDQSGTIIWVNQAFERITGYSEEEAKGQNPRILNAGVHTKAYFNAMWQSLENRGFWRGEIWNRRKDQSVYRQRLSTSRMQSPDGETYYIAVIHELSDPDDIQERLATLETTDPVTGLSNRGTMKSFIRRKLNRSDYNQDRFAVLTIEITNFHEINDTIGHSFGDKLLKAIADRLLTLVPDPDCLGRIGGDDFLVVLDGEGDELDAPINGLVEQLEQAFAIEDTMIYIQPSVGVSRFPVDCDDTDDLMQTATLAVGYARESVVDHVSYFSKTKADEIRRRFLIANQLKGAAKRQEWELVYQPIVDVLTGNLVKVEALLRWQSHELGRVSPGEFIPIAEKTGQIIDIGKWVLEDVCSQLAYWRKTGRNAVPVSVNLSVRQLEQESFSTGFKGILKHWRIPSEWIQVEITETLSKGNLPRILVNLNALSRMGIRIAIDDFGTGYSSFSYLTELGLNDMKVDQSFIRATAQEADTEKLVRAMLQIAEGLGLQTVAEGVETECHHEKIKALGFTYGQGYYYARPQRAEVFEREWLTTKQNKSI